MSTKDTTPAEVGSNDQLGLPAETLNCWRLNYGLTKTPNELHALWSDGAPPGAVMALRAAVLEIERQRSVLAAIDRHSVNTLRTNSKDRGDWAEDVAFMGKLARGH